MSLPPDQLARFAAREAREREFVGWVLAHYAESEGIDLTELARRLGATVEGFGRLQLCLRPRAACFADDVRRIAEHVGIDAGLLAAVVRRVDALETMHAGPAASDTGMLLAARARKPNQPNHPKGEP